IDMPVVGRALLDAPRLGFEGLVTDPVQGLGLPFMIVGPIITVICMVTFVAVSLRTLPPLDEQLQHVCWGSPLAALRDGERNGMRDPRVWSIVLFFVMFVLYIILR
ncbi:hypothetical protein KC734_04265, partial [candidate division KSB1 bacterium]|nr:hypothetical protein [candidate division KSB1 bacterium]